MQGKGEEFVAVRQSHDAHLTSSAPVSIARVLAARQDLLSIDKTNSAAVRKGTQCAVNKVVIGKVSLFPHVALLLETVSLYCRCLTEEGDPRRHAPLPKCHLSRNEQRHHRKEEKVCRVRQMSVCINGL